MKRLLLTLIFFSSPAWAQYGGGGGGISLSGDGWLRFGTGYLAYNTFETSQDETGETGTFGSNYSLPIQFQAHWDFYWGFQIAPRILYTPLAVEAPEGGSKSRILAISIPLETPIWGSLKGSFGLGYMIRTISGDGGTIELSNGLGTSTFLLPGESRSSKNFLFEAGLSYPVSSFTVNLESLWAGVFSERRSVSFLLTLNYQIL